MGEEPDAESIRHERERRRIEERNRIDHDRRERELELARLRRADMLQSIEQRRTGGRGDAEAQYEVHLRGDSPPVARTDAGEPPATVRPADRAVGRPIHSPSLRQLMALDPREKFDLQLLNTLTFPAIVDEAVRDPRLVEPLRRRAEALMARIKAEIDDPLNAGAFLREQVLLWYRSSTTDPEWARRMPDRWAGMFADSRVTGGRMRNWLNARLLGVYEGTLRAGRLGSRIRRAVRPSRTVEASMARTGMQLIQAEVAQAILDDLASRAREGEDPFPLVRLSELAVRRQVPTINEALALLFNSRETGPFIILHPNRYPDCEEVQIRPPAPAATGAALAFLLTISRAARRSAGRTASSGAPREDRDGAPGTPEGEGTDADAFDGTTIWEAPSVTAAAWKKLVDGCRQERRSLEAPPKEYRNRPAYEALRDVLLEDAEFRKAFLAARWRGRPAGIPLLASLLQKGTLAPEVATDYEYLEAELGALAADDPEWHPESGVWTIKGWTITREANSGEGVRYRAERAAEPAK